MLFFHAEKNHKVRVIDIYIKREFEEILATLNDY